MHYETNSLKTKCFMRLNGLADKNYDLADYSVRLAEELAA